MVPGTGRDLRGVLRERASGAYYSPAAVVAAAAYLVLGDQDSR